MANLRVTAGALRGRRLAVPRGDLRPTSERARQAFFNIVGKRIEGAHFLELFAGSGIFSFEAVSRGAASATAVDRERRRVTAIAETANQWNAPVTAIAGDVIATLPRLNTSFDVIYADPPYDYDRYDQLLTAIDRATLAEKPLVAIEHREKTDPFTVQPERLRLQRRAQYGEVWITFFA